MCLKNLTDVIHQVFEIQVAPCLSTFPDPVAYLWSSLASLLDSASYFPALATTFHAQRLLFSDRIISSGSVFSSLSDKLIYAATFSRCQASPQVEKRPIIFTYYTMYIGIFTKFYCYRHNIYIYIDINMGILYRS